MAAIKAALLEKDKLKTEEAVKDLQMKALAKKVLGRDSDRPEALCPDI